MNNNGFHTADLKTRARYRNEGKELERERILAALQELEEQSKKTRTPLYQETMFKAIREIINLEEA